MTHRNQIILSAFAALCFLLFSYWVTNLDFPLSGEKAVLGRLDFVRSMLIPTENKSVDSVLFINVSYDQELIPVKDEWGDTCGVEAITDRHKLLELLTVLRKREDYKYILLDVFFEKGYDTEIDSTLFATILSIPRIVIPYHLESEIADIQLLQKAGLADYVASFAESDFVKYPYYPNEGKSIPIRMYEEMTGNEIKKHGILYTDNGHLARKSIVLTFDLRADAPYDEGGEQVWYNLGTDILHDSNNTHLTRNKYIVIGSMKGDDVHMTFADKISGAVINFNAYISLLHGHHLVSIPLMILLYCVFFILSYLTLSRQRLQDILENWMGVVRNHSKYKLFKLLQILCSWGGYSLFLTILCCCTYIFWEEAYDIFITATLFYLYNILVAFVSNLKKKKA